MPDICDNSEGFSEEEPDELAEELTVELDEFEFSVESEELKLSAGFDELSAELEFPVELEEPELSFGEELEFAEEPTFSATEEHELVEEFSIIAPFEHPERQQTATAAVIIKRIFLFKSNTS